MNITITLSACVVICLWSFMQMASYVAAVFGQLLSCVLQSAGSLYLGVYTDTCAVYFHLVCQENGYLSFHIHPQNHLKKIFFHFQIVLYSFWIIIFWHNFQAPIRGVFRSVSSQSYEFHKYLSVYTLTQSNLSRIIYPCVMFI